MMGFGEFRSSGLDVGLCGSGRFRDLGHWGFSRIAHSEAKKSRRKSREAPEDPGDLRVVLHRVSEAWIAKRAFITDLCLSDSAPNMQAVAKHE